jgi:predicted enzyme involved in methoxymalonyl-ACP biosynthesis
MFFRTLGAGASHCLDRPTASLLLRTGWLVSSTLSVLVLDLDNTL